MVYRECNLYRSMNVKAKQYIVIIFEFEVCDLTSNMRNLEIHVLILYRLWVVYETE